MNTDRPEVAVVKELQTVREGTNVTLTCSAKGNPVPQVQWFRGGLNISLDVVGMATVHLRNVNRTSAGKYKCIATNLLGMDEKTSTLKVQRKYVCLK
jgi:hypothetical protein